MSKKPAETPKSSTAELEEAVLKKWQAENTFEKSRHLRADGKVFSIYDGPPFANGQPHFGHSLVNSIKDSIGRYKTMRGFFVERRNGWDTHGLPVEFAIEKQFGVSGKKEILELGLDKFNAACRESVFKYKHEHEASYARIGRWADTANAYATIDRTYTESVWWVMKQIHEKGLLYKGFKSLAYCPRCETPLSNFELNEGYRDDVEDPSLFVKFKLEDEDAYLLTWTTTPWSLPGNAAIAVKPAEKYVYVQLKAETGKSETLILAKKRLAAVLKDEKAYDVRQEVTGKQLAGKKYQPLFAVDTAGDKTDLYKVWAADFVDIEDGTGVLHVAPAFGEDDLELSQQFNLPVLSTIDASGHMSGTGNKTLDGLFFKAADRPVIEQLSERGLVFAAESIKHTYPFCYRCDTPLLYYAVDTWFIRVSSIRDRLLKTAGGIDWTPSHIKNGRFGKWLEGARDWAVSRNRYWGAPMPVWVNEKDPADYLVIGSIDELKQLAGEGTELEDLHRPFIDKVVIKRDGKTYRRVEEVIDCWFESGSMPVAQQHYPFENKDKFDQTFPADWIEEGLDQTRLWFYVLHVVATILFDKPAYRNVIVNGMILAGDGAKLSKRLQNYPPLDDVFDHEGADSLRLYLLSNNQATVSAGYIRFNRSGVGDINRNIVGTLLNSFRFYKMYADIDGFKPSDKLTQPKSGNILDEWMLARLNETIQEVTKQADDYKIARAITPLFELINDLSNWYIRRSRRRFWKSEDDVDKRAAYQTLHFTLVRVAQLLAPWAPFVSDYIYEELVGSSVHLSDWPKAEKVNQSVLDEMKWTREIINEGLAQRAKAGIKVRQPLSSITLDGTVSRVEEFKPIIADELNVKKVIARPLEEPYGKTLPKPEAGQMPPVVELDTKISDELKAEGMARELVRLVQDLRKRSGLKVDDRISLCIQSSDKLIRQSVAHFGSEIKQETLASKLVDEPQTHVRQANIDGAEVELSLAKIKA